MNVLKDRLDLSRPTVSDRTVGENICLARRFEIIVSIPGVGETTNAVIIVEWQEIATLSAKETAMLGGLAPVACDSGETIGARRIRGGRWHLRNAFFMPA